jgi:hypothetical protein
MSDFQWPEPTNEQLIELLTRTGVTDPIEHLRNAIQLDRQLLAGIDRKAAQAAWIAHFEHHAMGYWEWLFTRGGTVEPLPPPVPTLAEALEASTQLAGEAAGVVIRYLQAQQREGRE